MTKDLRVREALELRARLARDRDGMNVIVAGSDASVDRHKLELFGQESAPDLSPIDSRYVAPKVALIEWIGEPSPYDSDFINALRLRDMLGPMVRLVLEQLALQRRARVDRVTAWALGPREGLSKTYRWGKMPGTFVQEVAFVDVDRVLAIGASGITKSQQFRVLGSHADALPTQWPDEAWARVIEKLSRQQGIPGLPPGAEKLRIRRRDEEALVAINKAGTYGQWRS